MFTMIIDLRLFYLCSAMAILFFGFIIVEDFLQRRNILEYTGLKIGRGKYLVECDPKDFTGDIPLNMVQTTIDAKKLGLVPKVWALANSKEEIGHITRGRRIIHPDPLLVGYVPGVPDRVVVLAMWGNDVEDLDKYFQKRER